MLGRRNKFLEKVVESLTISVNDLTTQVEILKKELEELKEKVNRKV